MAKTKIIERDRTSRGSATTDDPDGAILLLAEAEQAIEIEIKDIGAEATTEMISTERSTLRSAAQRQSCDNHKWNIDIFIIKIHRYLFESHS